VVAGAARAYDARRRSSGVVAGAARAYDVTAEVIRGLHGSGGEAAFRGNGSERTEIHRRTRRRTYRT
jgi:hypothetical protein